MSVTSPQLCEEEGITFVLVGEELDRLSAISDASSQGEFSFEEVARGLSSPSSLDDIEFVRSDLLEKFAPVLTPTAPPAQPTSKKSKGRKKTHKPKRTHTQSNQEKVVSQGIKYPTHCDPPSMPLKHRKTYTLELSSEYDVMGTEKGDANIINFALEDTGKLGGLSGVFKTYKFVRVVANFSLKYSGPLKGSIYTTLLQKDSKTPTASEIPQMKKDNTCMEVDMATAPHFTRSLTPRFSSTKGSKSLTEWLPIMPTTNTTWFGIKYITEPTPLTPSLYLVSLKYTIAFRA